MKHNSTLRRVIHQLTFLVILTILAGCAQIAPLPSAQHIAFYQDTVLGFDFAVSPETQNVKVAIAYDRNTIAFVPVTEANGTTTGAIASTNAAPEAMSVIGLTKVTLPWIGHQEVTENIATGWAAQNIAESPQAIATLLKSTSPQKQQPIH